MKLPLKVPIPMPPDIRDALRHQTENRIRGTYAIKPIDGTWWVGVWSDDHNAFRVWVDDMVAYISLDQLSSVVLLEEEPIEIKATSILAPGG